jgi:integrase
VRRGGIVFARLDDVEETTELPGHNPLHDHRKRQLQARLAATDWEDNDLVFCTANGRPLAPTNVLRNLRGIQGRANEEAIADGAELLPRFDIHDLRHSHASHLLREGWDIVRVSRRLGHANPGITMTIYAHAIADTRDDDLVTPAAFANTGTD